MKKTIEDKIRTLEKQIKLCSILSIGAIAVTALLFAVEYAVAEYYKGAGWADGVVKGCIYTLYVMPFIIVIPLFVRVNLKNKLYQTAKQAEAE